ncbi:MAG: response regulator transcription factor [Planctomycetes bacterium]|nr:response regulator transcription factor [Planctomycetota bacterium]
MSVLEDEPAIQALFRNIGRIAGVEVATFGTIGQFEAGFDCDRVGCIVLDLNLPDGSGIDVLERLSQQECHVPVIFMSGIARVSEAVEAFRLGSLDFVEKPFDLDTMLAALNRAIETDRKRRNSSAGLREVRRRFDRLSPRETEVMELVVQGAANKEVAAHLGLSPKTIEVHRANVMRKTEAQSVAELVRMHVRLTS